MAKRPLPKHDMQEYPERIQQAGPQAMRTYDRLEAALLKDGFTHDDVAVLMYVNLDKVLTEAMMPSKKQEPHGGTSPNKTMA